MSRRKLVVVTGPARSGKSEWAEYLAQQSGKPVVYIATAQVDPEDAEWQARIQAHQRRRPATWETRAVPTDLAATLQTLPADVCVLVDSLGTWLANLLTQDEAQWQASVEELLAIAQLDGPELIVVAEETGWGVVPAFELGRLFRDRLGHVTRCLGAIAEATYLVTGGYAIDLSRVGIPLPSVSSTSALPPNFNL